MTFGLSWNDQEVVPRHALDPDELLFEVERLQRVSSATRTAAAVRGASMYTREPIPPRPVGRFRGETWHTGFPGVPGPF